MDNNFIKEVCDKLKSVWTKGNSYTDLRMLIESKLGFSILGRGSARIVYALGDELVLKLAVNRKGTAQNQVECKIYQECGADTPTLNEIISYDDEYFIYEVQKYAKTLNEKKFQKTLGIDLYEFEDAILGINRNPMSADAAIMFYTSIGQDDDAYEKLIPIFDCASKLRTKYKSELGDMTKPNSYGLNENGEVKLLDYGMTQEVWNKFYKKE